MYIYQIIQQNKTVYIGSSKSLKLREGHYTYLGTGLSIHLLESVDPEVRYEREQYWIDKFRAEGRPLQNKQRAVAKPKVQKSKPKSRRIHYYFGNHLRARAG